MKKWINWSTKLSIMLSVCCVIGGFAQISTSEIPISFRAEFAFANKVNEIPIIDMRAISPLEIEKIKDKNKSQNGRF
ncbi:hypothetical protein [Snuella lapsa]